MRKHDCDCRCGDVHDRDMQRHMRGQRTDFERRDDRNARHDRRPRRLQLRAMPGASCESLRSRPPDRGDRSGRNAKGNATVPWRIRLKHACRQGHRRIGGIPCVRWPLIGTRRCRSRRAEQRSCTRAPWLCADATNPQPRLPMDKLFAIDWAEFFIPTHSLAEIVRARDLHVPFPFSDPALSPAKAVLGHRPRRSAGRGLDRGCRAGRLGQGLQVGHRRRRAGPDHRVLGFRDRLARLSVQITCLADTAAAAAAGRGRPACCCATCVAK